MSPTKNNTTGDVQHARNSSDKGAGTAGAGGAGAGGSGGGGGGAAGIGASAGASEKKRAGNNAAAIVATSHSASFVASFLAKYRY